MHPWQEQMKAPRARTAKPGIADPQVFERKSGPEFLQAMLRGEITDPPISQTLDFHLIEVETGRAVFQGLPAYAHFNPIATVHGGWHATPLDSAMACAVQAICEVSRAYTTLEFKIHCVRPLTDKTGPIRAEEEVIAGGGRTQWILNSSVV
jgi:uncharacterized protein (TIGR00369 family)